MLDHPKHHNPLTHFINSISSYDSNIMLAAVISLLVVILFVLLLHIYAKWFLTQATNRRRRSSTHVLLPSRLINQYFHSYDNFHYTPTKGLHQSIISSIPLFVYRAEEYEQVLECVICLSVFEENEIGRRLIKCGHCFHVECIDMWLHSHTSCPTCRAPVIVESGSDVECRSLESHVIDISSENENGNSIVVVNHDTLPSPSPLPTSPPSPSPSPSSSLGYSLKRMLSGNRSESNKVIITSAY